MTGAETLGGRKGRENAVARVSNNRAHKLVAAVDELAN
jgi:hypothetical protein